MNSSVIPSSLYPFTSRYCPIKGLKMHYVDEGAGEPVVLVHGNPTWSWFYRTTISALRDHCRVIAPDHIGMGLSEKPTQGYPWTLQRRVEDFTTFIDHLNLKEKLTLVVHDWGGMIAFSWAVDHPDLVRRIVVLNSAAFTMPVTKKLPLFLKAAKFPGFSFPLMRWLNAFVRGTLVFGVTKKLSPPVKRGYHAPWSSWQENRAVHAFVQDIPLGPEHPSWHTLSRTESSLHLLQKIPLLLCWGMKDFVFDRSILRAWERFFPDARVCAFPEGGHLLLEDEADGVNEAVLEFIRDPGGDAPAPPADEGYRPLSACMAEIFAARGDAPAVAVAQGLTGIFRPSWRIISYRELDLLCHRMGHGLRRAGITRGMHTLLMVKPGVEFIALTVALLRVGAVPVVVDPGMGLKNLYRSIREAEPEAIIGVPRAQLARLLLRWSPETIRITIGVGFFPFPGVISLSRLVARTSGTPYPLDDPQPTRKAAVMFTSGNTGVPKGVVYSHGNFSAVLRMLEAVYDLRPGDSDLATFPPFALFSPGIGMTSVIPRMDATRPASADPRQLLRALREHRCTMMFGSPAILEILGRYCEARGVALPTLTRVISAGAPARIPSLRRFAALLSHGVEVFTPYGATEALPVSSIGSAELLGDTARRTEEGGGICVGRPLPGIDIAVIPFIDGPVDRWCEKLRLPPWEMGEIVVAGFVVTAQYYNRPDLTALAKIPENGRVRHRMGDVGYFDDQGRLWMCGRMNHRVITADRIHYTIPCEAVFNRHPLVYRSALVGVMMGGKMEPVICVERTPEGRRYSQKELVIELLEIGARYEHTAVMKRFIFHNSFPMDIRHNAKIFREKLARWAAGRIS